MPIITLFDYNSKSIYVRQSDGYFNATQICQATGKRLNNFIRNNWTEDYLNELEALTQIRATALVQVIQGGVPQEQGTWVHPTVALRLAQWISPKFAAKMDIYVRRKIKEDELLANKWKELESTLLLGDIPIRPTKEDDLCRRIHSWAAICGYHYNIEHPFINTINSKTKTRRIDLIKFNGRNVVIIEVKLNHVTGKDVYNTVIDREYINLVRNYVNRPVKLIMLSPFEADNEVNVFIKQSKENIEFKLINTFCEELFYKSLKSKWKDAEYFIRQQALNDYFKPLFSEYFLQQQYQLSKVRCIAS